MFTGFKISTKHLLTSAKNIVQQSHIKTIHSVILVLVSNKDLEKKLKQKYFVHYDHDNYVDKKTKIIQSESLIVIKKS